jgi:hypothetical protein
VTINELIDHYTGWIQRYPRDITHFSEISDKKESTYLDSIYKFYTGLKI